MKSIHLKLPDTLHSALEKQQRETGEPIPHIIRAALAEYLQVEHATLFQVSTSTSLVEGIYQGAVSIARLRDHGDFGLGTFEGLDGEMVAFDGQFFQVRSDGTVRAADDDATSPFAAVTHFIPEQSATVAEVPELAALLAELDKLRGTDNLFYAIRVDGRFGSIHTRAMCRTDEGVPLAIAAAHQPEFRMNDIGGTMVGFWSPLYVKTLEVPGYHLHFISADRRTGGHLMECSGRGLRVQIARVSELRVALPENKDFLQADLTRDPSRDLDRAEHVRKKD